MTSISAGQVHPTGEQAADGRHVAGTTGPVTLSAESSYHARLVAAWHRSRSSMGLEEEFSASTARLDRSDVATRPSRAWHLHVREIDSFTCV